jgi:hypothetical protein
MTTNYYTTQREALLEEFDSLFKFARPHLVTECGKINAAAIIADTRRQFAALIPDIPYIGGRDNVLTENLVMSAWCLAFFRVMKNWGRSRSEAYAIIYSLVDQWLRRNPSSHVKATGALRRAPIYISSLKKHAQHSLLREFPGDWVYTFVEGDGNEFDYGLDYTECGICKFFHDQAADDLVPYLCALDFPLTRARGLAMKRTMTLSSGAQKCDFRICTARKLENPDLSMQDIGIP